MIYFAQIKRPDGPIKIGYTKDPKKRIKYLGKFLPWGLELIHTLPGSLEEERQIHKRLRNFRIFDSAGREWFNADCLKFLNFLKQIEEKNLSADRYMTPEEQEQYIKIFIDNVSNLGSGENKNP